MPALTLCRRRPNSTVCLAAIASLLAWRFAPAQDRLYVADQGAGVVIGYPLPSTTGTTFGSGANPELYGLATGASGQLYTVNNTGDLIRRFEADGTLAAGFGSNGEVDIKTLTAGTAFGPSGVAFTAVAGGQVVVSAYNSGHLLRLDATTGVWDTAFGSGGLVTTTASPLGVAYAAAGDYIYYTQTDGSVWRVTADGTENVAMNLGGTLPSSPWAIGLLSDTELFITDIGTNEVLKYNLTGTNALLDAAYGSGGRVDVGLDGVYGIALARSGTAFVTSSSGIVNMIDPAGSQVQQFVTGLGSPTGVAVFSSVGGVPEIDPAGMATVAALVTGAIGLLEGRRRRGTRGGLPGPTRSPR